MKSKESFVEIKNEKDEGFVVVPGIGESSRIKSVDALIDRFVLSLATLLRGKTLERPLSTDHDVVRGRLLPSGSDAAVLIDKDELILWVDAEPAEAFHPIHAFAATRRDALLKSASRLSDDPVVLTGRWTDRGGTVEGRFVPYVITVLSDRGPKATLIPGRWFGWDKEFGFEMISCHLEQNRKMDVIAALQDVTDQTVAAANDALYDGEVLINGILWQIDARVDGRVIVATEPSDAAYPIENGAVAMNEKAVQNFADTWGNNP